MYELSVKARACRRDLEKPPGTGFAPGAGCLNWHSDRLALVGHQEIKDLRPFRRAPISDRVRAAAGAASTWHRDGLASFMERNGVDDVSGRTAP